MWIEVRISVCPEEEKRGGGGGGGGGGCFQSQNPSIQTVLLLALALSPSLVRGWLRRKYRQCELKLESVFAQKKTKRGGGGGGCFSLRIPRSKLSTVGWLRRKYRQCGLKLESVFAQKKKKKKKKKKKEEEEEEEGKEEEGDAFSLRIPRSKLSTVGSRSFFVFGQRLV